MPGEHHIHVLEEAGVEHVDLAASALFGGRAVVADGAFEPAGLHLFLGCDRSQGGAAAQQIVAAAVAGSAGGDRLLGRSIFLRQAGEGVELSHDADHRLAAAPGGGETGGHPGDGVGDGEAVGAQFVAQESGGFLFVEAEFGRFQICREMAPKRWEWAATRASTASSAWAVKARIARRSRGRIPVLWHTKLPRPARR